MEYPWYQILTSDTQVQQGDFIPDCPVVVPPAKMHPGEEIEVDIQLMNVIILSQSCDLANKNIEIILVCPFSKATEYLQLLPPEQTSTSRAKFKIIDNIRKGYLPAYHLLNKQEEIFNDYLVVDFKNVYGIHRNTLTEIVNQQETRIRLLPPYREHLSQSFARYFMRVGLPQDLTIEGF